MVVVVTWTLATSTALCILACMNRSPKFGRLQRSLCTIFLPSSVATAVTDQQQQQHPDSKQDGAGSR